MKKIVFVLFLVIYSFSLFGQVASDTVQLVVHPVKHKKGQLYIYWGWNREMYTKSDLHFSGDHYNFILSDVVAKDRQSPVAADPYLNPGAMTIPQTNLRIGYFFDDHWNISFGADHMKYVMQQDQIVKINGEIQQTDSTYDGSYNNDDILLSPEFLKFEHTDGLNYLNVELRRFDQLIDLKKYNMGNIDINITEGFGMGVLYPRTNVTLMGFERNDEFHVAGYGMGAVVGLNITFWKYFFLQSECKGGFINMPNIRTTHFDADRAKQHFFFLQGNLTFGFNIDLSKS